MNPLGIFVDEGLQFLLQRLWSTADVMAKEVGFFVTVLLTNIARILWKKKLLVQDGRNTSLVLQARAFTNIFLSAPVISNLLLCK